MQRWRLAAAAPEAGASGSSVPLQPDSPAARAPTPTPPAEPPVHAGGGSEAGNGEGSTRQRSSFLIHADGSNHGGRRYFEEQAPSQPLGQPQHLYHHQQQQQAQQQQQQQAQQYSREEQWHAAMAQEAALEGHSLQPGVDHPAVRPQPPHEGQQEAPAAGQQQGSQSQLSIHWPSNEDQEPQDARHHAVWIVEDGSSKGPAQHPSSTAQAPAGAAGGGGGSGGGSSVGGHKSGGAGNGSFAGAKVVIEQPNERKYFSWSAYWGSLPKKLKGGLDTRLPIPSWRDVFWSWLGAFIGILAVCSLNEWVTPEIDIALLVGSFGASAVLVFAMLESKMAQPRNFLGGQLISAVVGITTRVVIHQTWIAGPVGMSLALVCMMLTSTTHPPGGATALIAATMEELPRWHGYSYLVTVGLGSVVMQLIALVVNNLDPHRRYPTFWI